MIALKAIWRPLPVRILVLSAVLVPVIVTGSTAGAQSTDAVHIVPGSGSTGHDASATSPELNLNTRPIRSDVDLVLVPVTVTDPMNRPVINLNQQDFTLYEGAVQQEIRYISHEDAPISIVVLDCSASMKNKIEYE